MMVVRFRSESEAKDTLKKLKKMKSFVKEMIECFEDKIEDDDDEDYRCDDEDDEYEPMSKHEVRHRRGRYRRGM
jgi:hypothetical protein